MFGYADKKKSPKTQKYQSIRFKNSELYILTFNNP